MSATTAVPRLTLGLPVYNGERFLAASLDALLAQTFTDFELIISDNGSTDRTSEIAQHYAVDGSPRAVRPSPAKPRLDVQSQLRDGADPRRVLQVGLRRRPLRPGPAATVYRRPRLPARDRPWRMPGRRSSTKRARSLSQFEYALTTDVPDPVERFRSVLYTDGGDDMYGVMRMSVLRQIAPFGSYHWADRTFVAELALHGPFHNVPEFLYFRRDHPMRTSRVGRDNIRRRCARLDPARANRWRHPLVRLIGEYLLGFVSAIFAGSAKSKRPLALPEGACHLGCRVMPAASVGAERRGALILPSWLMPCPWPHAQARRCRQVRSVSARSSSEKASAP